MPTIAPTRPLLTRLPVGVQALSRILALTVDPVTESTPALRQTMMVALAEYAAAGAPATRVLSRAVKPAARRAMAGTGGLRAGPQLLTFVSQLLQVSPYFFITIAEL